MGRLKQTELVVKANFTLEAHWGCCLHWACHAVHLPKSILTVYIRVEMNDWLYDSALENVDYPSFLSFSSPLPSPLPLFSIVSCDPYSSTTPWLSKLLQTLWWFLLNVSIIWHLRPMQEIQIIINNNNNNAPKEVFWYHPQTKHVMWDQQFIQILC